MYIITAWDEVRDTQVRAASAEEAIRAARDLVSQGMRVSILNTKTGDSVAITELEADVGRN